MFDRSYDFMLRPYFKQLFGPSKAVAHQQTCPTCGRKLVNIYRHSNGWMCKRCFDAGNNDAEHG